MAYLFAEADRQNVTSAWLSTRTGISTAKVRQLRHPGNGQGKHVMIDEARALAVALGLRLVVSVESTAKNARRF